MPVEKPPAWAAALVAMLKQGGPPRGRSPGERDRQAGLRSPSPSSRQRSTSPGGFWPKGKFVFRGGAIIATKRDIKSQTAPSSWRSSRGTMANLQRATKVPGRMHTRSVAKTKRPELLTKMRRQTIPGPPHLPNTEDENSDFFESELLAIAQNGGIVAALTRHDAIDTHNSLVVESGNLVWEPVKMSTDSKMQLLSRRTRFSDRSNSNKWSGLTTATPN